MSSAAKDTIYIDVDDEITSVIEKVREAPHKIVALVLPKRATMLQSIVNMKLLKRTADDAKKNLVLITSEASLLPLAGAVGLHVAKTPQSKPAIPPPPATPDSDDSIEEVAEDEAEIDASKPIGELAGLPTNKDPEETIEVGDIDEEAPVTAATKPKPKKKDKKLKIPNFNKFRLKLFLGIGALLFLIIGWYLANYVLPSAAITIQTDTNSVNSNINFTLRPGLEELNTEQSLVPGASKELRKTDTEKTAATGQKDVGEKASGDMTLFIACSDVDGSPPTIPAGTGVSTGNLTFITQKSASLTTPDFSNGCQFKGSTEVVAQNSGDQYNVGERNYTVSGYPDVTGRGSAMTGGTSKIVKIVRQEDVDSAKDKLAERNDDAAKEELRKQLEDESFLPLDVTFRAGEPTVAASPNVGAEADEVTITSTTVYTMNGVKRSELDKLIAEDVKDDIDPSQQAILNHGLDNATFRVLSVEANGDVRLALQTLVTIGPEIKEAELKQEILGKKKGETVEIIRNRPGIKDVTVDYSPFWVFSTPKKEGKITITFEGANDADTGTESE